MSVLASPLVAWTTAEWWSDQIAWILGVMLLMLLASALLRHPFRSTEQLGMILGAVAGVLQGAISGTYSAERIFQRSLQTFWLMPLGCVVFAWAALVVAVAARGPVDRGNLVRTWTAAGMVIGPAISVLSAILSNSRPNAPLAGVLLAGFIGGLFGDLLAGLAVAEYERDHEK